MEEKRRLFWIEKDPTLYQCNYMGLFDLPKGIIMVGIILLHCVNNYCAPTVFVRSHGVGMQLLFSPFLFLDYGAVPMLFMICGYGIRKQGVKNSIRNAGKVFLFPYFCVIVAVSIVTLAKQLLVGGNLLERFRYQVLPLLLGWHPGQRFWGNMLDQIGPIWFFLTFTLGSIYLNLVLQQKEVWLQVMFISAGVVVALITTELPLPYCIQQTLICSALMYVGMQLKKSKIPQKRLPLWLVVMTYLVCLYGSARGGCVEFADNAFNLGGADLLLAGMSGVVLLCLLLRLNVCQGVIADALRWIGQRMMWFCCVHTVSFLVGPWKRMALYFKEYPVVGILLECTISFLYAVIVCLLLDAMIRIAIKKRKAGF